MDVKWHEMLERNCDQEERRRILKKYLRMVEIEVFSYCNRQCWFCSNRIVDRRGENIYMPEDLYVKVLDELAEIGFDGMISYSRYNEPLADSIILTRLEQARKIVPDAVLHTNTNGDFVTLEYLEALARAGLDSLNVQVYLREDDVYSNEMIQRKIEDTDWINNMPYEITDDDPGMLRVRFLNAPIKHLYMYGRDFRKNGTHRAGLVSGMPDGRRTMSCYVPFVNMYIDYNGTAVPCCNIRSDAEGHFGCDIGDIAEDTLWDIYFSTRAILWRNHLKNHGPKAPPCTHCNFANTDKLDDFFDWRERDERFGK